MRRILLAAVRFYRRYLSGRGPLAGVQCTFGAQESCSAFAERILEEVPVDLALPRVARRLRRCRSLTLYTLGDGTLGWADGFQAIASSAIPSRAIEELSGRLASDGETEAMRSAVRRAAVAVEAAAAGRSSEMWAEAHASEIPIRNAEELRKLTVSQLKRRAKVAAVACAAVVASSLAAPTPFLIAPLATVGLLSMVSAVFRRTYLKTLDDLTGRGSSGDRR